MQQQNKRSEREAKSFKRAQHNLDNESYQNKRSEREAKSFKRAQHNLDNENYQKMPKTVFKLQTNIKYDIPLILARIPAGFPSPAEDYVEQKLDLNQYLIKHPSATFFVRADGESMTGAGINSGDMLIVDRATKAANNSVVLAVINGDFTIKRIRKVGEKIFLIPENPNFKPIEITADMEFEIWGTVLHVIRSM